MGRLTERDKNNHVHFARGIAESYTIHTREHMLLSRLAAYEDSGLTPEEVAEVAKIVRCKDCAKVHPDEMFGEYWCNGERVEANHFCSYGEKKGN